MERNLLETTSPKIFESWSRITNLIAALWRNAEDSNNFVCNLTDLTIVI